MKNSKFIVNIILMAIAVAGVGSGIGVGLSTVVNRHYEERNELRAFHQGTAEYYYKILMQYRQEGYEDKILEKYQVENWEEFFNKYREIE